MSNSTVDLQYASMYTALFFATVMSAGFYGVTCMQTFFYYIHYPHDAPHTKSFVATLWALDTTHQALTISGAYKYMMAGLVNPLSFVNMIPELVLQILFTAMVAVATQGFFVYRIYVFSGRKVVGPLVWAPLAMYQLAGTTVYVTKAFYSSDGVHSVDFSVLSDRFFMIIATSSLSVAAGVDVMIAVFLTFLLVRKRATTEFASTAHILQRLTLFVVNSGVWTAMFALLTLIFLQVYPSNLMNAVFCFPLSSVYCNTLLANLNARAYIRGETATHNIDADLFSSTTSPVPNSAKNHRDSRVVSFRTSANVEGHGGVTFLVANRTTLSTPENASV